MKKIDYFIGKPCTILTREINRNFLSEEEFKNISYTYMVGIVESIDADGILLKRINSNLKMFFLKQNVVGIVEEMLQEVPIKEEIKKEELNIQPIEGDEKISIEELEKIK